MVRYYPCPSPYANDGVPLQLKTTKNKGEYFNSFNFFKKKLGFSKKLFSFHLKKYFVILFLIDFLKSQLSCFFCKNFQRDYVIKKTSIFYLHNCKKK